MKVADSIKIVQRIKLQSKTASKLKTGYKFIGVYDRFGVVFVCVKMVNRC